ncbi:MAG: hypothetical protein U9R19_02830 [Bacteroidota bacterium]|nr:hypothetical protein [Bacteroidota bacterium]
MANNKLKADGNLKRIDSKKSGHWEISENLIISLESTSKTREKTREKKTIIKQKRTKKNYKHIKRHETKL